jgi:hypothetical protein
MGQGVGVAIDDSNSQCLCKVDIKPWLFSKRKGYKNLEVDSDKVIINWDLSNAKFGSGPEPLEGFYLAITFNLEMVLLLGDMKKEASRRLKVLRCIPRPFSSLEESIFLGRSSIVQKLSFLTRARCMMLQLNVIHLILRIPVL